MQVVDEATRDSPCKEQCATFQSTATHRTMPTLTLKLLVCVGIYPGERQAWKAVAVAGDRAARAALHGDRKTGCLGAGGACSQMQCVADMLCVCTNTSTVFIVYALQSGCLVLLGAGS